MCAQLLHAEREALLLLDIGNSNHLLVHPNPSTHTLVHRKSVALSAFLVPLPVVRDHAILTRIVLREFQEVAARQVQDAGGKFFEQIRQIAGPNHHVGGLEQPPIAVALRPWRVGPMFVPVLVLASISLKPRRVLPHADTSYPSAAVVYVGQYTSCAGIWG